MEKINDLQLGIENNLRIYRENIYKKDIDGSIYAHDWKVQRLYETLDGLYSLVCEVGNLKRLEG